jgi:hypothetical protein
MKEAISPKRKSRKKTIEPLTKRTLVSAAKTAFKNASEETMEVMGYNVVAENGFVVKIFADGRKEIISAIPKREKITPAQIQKALES